MVRGTFGMPEDTRNVKPHIMSAVVVHPGKRPSFETDAERLNFRVARYPPGARPTAVPERTSLGRCWCEGDFATAMCVITTTVPPNTTVCSRSNEMQAIGHHTGVDQSS